MQSHWRVEPQYRNWGGGGANTAQPPPDASVRSTTAGRQETSARRHTGPPPWRVGPPPWRTGPPPWCTGPPPQRRPEVTSGPERCRCPSPGSRKVAACGSTCTDRAAPHSGGFWVLEAAQATFDCALPARFLNTLKATGVHWASEQEKIL